MRFFSPTLHIQKFILSSVGDKVHSGVFRGLFLANKHVAAAGIPTLLGTYEKEIESYFSATFLEKYNLFIDIGAGEGYFANGVLKNQLKINCLAFEQNPAGRDLIFENAKLNGFENRMTIKGSAEPSALNQTLENNEHKNILILVDVEGYEEVLLNPITSPLLIKTDIIVEVHECFKFGLEKLIKERFESSHKIQIVSAKKRELKDFPIPTSFWRKFLFKKYIVHLMGEGRPVGMKWFILSKK